MLVKSMLAGMLAMGLLATPALANCGKCCGDKGATTRPSGDCVYVCPMGDYKSDKPGKCPKCGMETKKQEPTTKPAEEKHEGHEH